MSAIGLRELLCLPHAMSAVMRHPCQCEAIEDELVAYSRAGETK
jgi:hypothetical protein